MDEQQSRPESRSRLSEAYERILTRLKDGGGELSWESFQHELDEAVAFESEFEEFTKDEMALLRAWVERDMRDFRQFLAKGARVSRPGWASISTCCRAGSARRCSRSPIAPHRSGTLR